MQRRRLKTASQETGVRGPTLALTAAVGADVWIGSHHERYLS